MSIQSGEIANIILVALMRRLWIFMHPHLLCLVPKVRYPHYSALIPKVRYPHYSALAPKVRYLHYSGARVRMVPIVPTLAEHFPGSLECIFLWGRSGWHLDRATLPILCPLRMPGCAILRWRIPCPSTNPLHAEDTRLCHPALMRPCAGMNHLLASGNRC